MTDTPATRPSLIHRLGDSNDQEAWVEFVRLYEPVIYRVLRRYGLQEVDAHDLMQELFVKVAQHVERWEPTKERDAFRSWLRRIARNLALNWLKQRQGRECAAGGSDAYALLCMEPDDSHLESAEFDREVRRGLFKLAAAKVREQVHKATWEAFWETAIVGATPAAAAKQLSMTVGAVRVARCRVLARLRLEIETLEQQ
jgi:RNA polymerase sigma factor (sigma-70 family)